MIVTDDGPGGSPTVQLAGTGSGIVINGFVGISSMGIPRAQHAATLLPNGKVLITGGAPTTVAQLYDPGTTAFTLTGNNMSTTRTWHVTRQIKSGNVLVVGGVDASGNYLASAELYDYKANTFSPAGSMSTPRAMPTATWLATPGKLLVTGGLSASDSSGPLASAQLYDATSGTFSLTGSMYTPRYNHAASPLPDGTVLITGGRCDPSPNCAPDVGISAEIYNPTTGTFVRISNMNVSRVLHASTALKDGTVLITGGFIGTVNTAEIYNPATQTFVPTATEMVGGSLVEHRAQPLGTDQKNTNQVLITGGNDTTEAQVYDLATQTFTAVGSMTTPRSFHTASTVKNGVILVTGGSDEPCEGVLRKCPQQWASAEIYTLPTITVTVSPTTLSFGGQLVGTTSSPQPVTVTNTGNSQVNITNVGVTGDFAVQSNQCQAALQPGNSCSLSIVFAPAALGTRNGTLTITDNATNSPQTVALSGTGTTTTTTTLKSSLNPSTYGKSVTLTAVVVSAISGTPTGNLTFYDGATSLGSATLSSGTATLTTSNLTGGSHSLTALYPGDGTFGASTSPVLSQTVVQAVVGITLTSSLNPSYVNQSVTFSVVVSGSPATPTGSVTFKEGTTILGNVPLVNGQASFTKTYTKAGTFSIVASYSGDQNYKAKNSTAVKQVVKQYTTSTVLASSLNPSTYGQAVILTATVSSAGPAPTGTVTFKNGSTSLGIGTLVGGVAKITKSTLPSGTLAITATYNGNTVSAKSTSPTLTQVVNKATSTTKITSSVNPSTVGQAVKFTATVKSLTVVAVGTVTFTAGTTTLGTVSLASGKASLTTSALPKGTTTVTATYNGTHRSD